MQLVKLTPTTNAGYTQSWTRPIYVNADRITYFDYITSDNVTGVYGDGFTVIFVDGTPATVFGLP